jgi:nucleotide-binding universal stress UspA family protein
MTRWSLMNESTDKIVVAHCWSAKKNEYLPMDQKNDFIRDRVDTECIALKDRWVFDSMEMVEGGKAAKELLNDAAQRNKAHVCVVGYHGRKGPKKDPTVMGTAVQYMGVHATVPVFILKDPIRREDKENKAFRFAACCDGSD